MTQPPTTPTSSNPHSSRTTVASALLVSQAVLAQLAYWALAMLVWAPLVIMTAIFYPASWAWAAFALLSIGTWWLLQPSVDLDEPIVTRSEAPRLFALLDSLSDKLDAPPIDEVRLTDDLNAGALDARGWMGLIANRRTLLLGIPLLQVLNQEQVAAVIAHELGHFSKRHGRMGHWIYRVRAGWSTYLYTASCDGDDGIDRVRRWAARLLLPGFLKRSSTWSKQCEYEADALAAEAAGATPLLVGLARLQATDQYLDTAYQRPLARRQQTDLNPPTDYWAWVKQLVVAHAQSQIGAERKAQPRRAPALWDTHPLLQERAAALGIAEPAPTWDDQTCAGLALLGDVWPTHFNDCNQRWSDTQRHGWRLRHMHLNRLTRQPGEAAPVTDEHRLEQTVLGDELEHTDASLQTLAALAETSPQAHYQWGQALLRRNDDQGVAEIREAIRRDRRLALQGYAAILAHVSRHGTLAQIQEYDTRLSRAWDRVSIDAVSLQIYVQRAALDAPPAHWQQLLGAALADVPHIDGMWIVSTHTSMADGEPPRRLHVAFLRQQPANDADAVFSGDGLARQVRNGLTALAPATDLVEVSTWFTTEALSPQLLDRLTALPGSQILAPRTPFNRDIVRFDSV